MNYAMIIEQLSLNYIEENKQKQRKEENTMQSKEEF